MAKEKSFLPSIDFASRQNWVEAFLNFDINNFERLLRTKNENFWWAKGEKKALKLFQEAAVRVPAYKNFLRGNHVKPELVKTIKDFSQVPLTNKKNYIEIYPLVTRCWDGEIANSALLAISSGTSGDPKFWPRAGYQEYEAGIIHELIYSSIFEISKYKTLLLIGFPMGVYVSGIATVLPSWLITQKGYPLTIATVGNNKAEMLRTLKSLKANYEQVVLVGHPFFIKDVIETGIISGINWAEKRLRIMFCSEGFSEPWRDFLTKEAKLKNKILAAVNTYGSSEFLLMGHETVFTTRLRKLLERNVALSESLFQTKLVPNLFQFNPYLRYIEEVDNELIFTSASGLPLVRFNLHDSGQIKSSTAIASRLSEKPEWKLPLVALWGRSDQTVVFYAANIYPEQIHSALNHPKFLKRLTGKFAMRKGYLKNMDEYLEINIELKTRITASSGFKKIIQDYLMRRLLEINLEFSDAHTRFPKETILRVKFWPYQHIKYFRPGLKPRYIVTT